MAAACANVDAGTVIDPADPSATAPTIAPSTTVPLRAQIDETVTLDFEGNERRYELFAAGGFPDTPSAVVVDLHGALGTPADQDALSGMRRKAAQEGFVVAQPAGLLRSWDTISGNGSDVAFIRAVVADVAARTAIDPQRIYATGMSNGGGMADRLGCAAPDLFAAIAPVAGWYVPAVACAGAPVPVMAFHGTADPVVPYEGAGALFVPVEEWADAWAERNGCAPGPLDEQVRDDVVVRTWSDCDVEVALYVVQDGGHGWPGTTDPIRAAASTGSIDATELIWDFFAANPKP